MKIKYSSIVGILVMLVLIASFVTPAKLATPEPVSAQQPPMEWLPVDTPDTMAGIIKELYTPSWAGHAAYGTYGPNGPEMGTEITKLLVGNNGTTMYVQYARGDEPASNNDSRLRILKSVDGGVSWSPAPWANLDFFVTGGAGTTIVWNIAIAPDNPEIIAAAVSIVTAVPSLTNPYQRVWISTNGGTSWDNTNWPQTGSTVLHQYISCLDISMDYGGARDILVGTRGAAVAGTNNLQTMKMPGYGGWNVQDIAIGVPDSVNPFTGDVIDAVFSPTYIGDSTIVVLYSQAAANPGTWLVTGAHDTIVNNTIWQVQAQHISIKNAAEPVANSPTSAEIITGEIQLPSDFSGQSASLRRFYVATDGLPAAGPTFDVGVYRIDDNVVYTLMDNTTTSFAVAAGVATRRAAHIAYWGTYASGKLMVGERLGEMCTANVPTWFTDSPTVCPVPCWYPAKKPVSGAGGSITCFPINGYGNAMPVWSPTYAAQGVAYAVTSASSYDAAYAALDATPQVGAVLTWPGAIMTVVQLDESAFSLTRNNGETWNQLSLIDTRMNKLTDVAPSADCTTVYLASTNNGQNCAGFDSVWRSSMNEKVVAPPLPALPIGAIWERVLHRVTARTCNQTTLGIESNYAILRLAPDKLDGQVVGWAAGGAGGRAIMPGIPAGVGLPVGANQAVMAWSPDFGDYWANITPRLTVEDFAFESSTIIYVLQMNTGNVQKMPYTGTAWSSSLPSVSTQLGGGHTIEAKAADKILVGNQAVANGAATPFVAAISTDGGMTFMPMIRPVPQTAQWGYHAIFDADYGVGNNTTIYAGDDANNAGLIWRNNAPAGAANVPWTDMCTNYTTHTEYYGLVQSNSKNVAAQGTLYAAHTGNVTSGFAWSGVERTLAPLDGIPKPGIEWSCLDASATPYQANTPQFDLEPKSLKICGCLTQDTNSTLWAIDNRVYSNNHARARGTTLAAVGANVAPLPGPPAIPGRLWTYVDCVAKVGPTLAMDDGTIIGCDPATGRAQEVNFTWEQICIANAYQLQIAKDDAFTLMVFNPFTVAPFLVPASVTSPSFMYLSNEGVAAPFVPLECGHTYYWKVRVANETTNDAVPSPFSEIRSFTIKAGFRVTTPYYGLQLLEPDNGCGCACDAPICFSWSPFKETTEYMFELSENSDLSSPLVSTTVPTTAYQYTGTVECNKNYFWRVMAVKPAPSEWSAVFSFMTQPEPPALTPPPAEPGIPIWVWTLIAIGTILIILTLVLVVKTRRRL